MSDNSWPVSDGQKEKVVAVMSDAIGREWRGDVGSMDRAAFDVADTLDPRDPVRKFLVAAISYATTALTTEGHRVPYPYPHPVGDIGRMSDAVEELKRKSDREAASRAAGS